MNRILPALLIILLSALTVDAQLIRKELIVDGTRRVYLVHLPVTYGGEAGLPLVINMHGLGSDGTEQAAYSRFNSFSDLNNFIVVYPEGLEANVPEIEFTGKHWNAYFETGIDDVSFIDLLIDIMWNTYEIDVSRVYATGMSNGGFMAYTLSCELNDRIAAMSSVTGSMVLEGFGECTPERPVPVLQFQGTADEVVPYEGRGSIQPIETVIEFWTDINGCVTDGVVGEDLEDINMDDNSTVTLFQYTDCDEDVKVELYRINNGGHTWPGAFIELPQAGPTNKDINASQLTWDFFTEYQHPNPRTPEVITSVVPEEQNTEVYPTLLSNILHVSVDRDSHYTLMTMNGSVLTEGNLPAGTTQINTENWPEGVLLFQLKSPNQAARTSKLIK